MDIAEVRTSEVVAKQTPVGALYELLFEDRHMRWKKFGENIMSVKVPKTAHWHLITFWRKFLLSLGQ
jgi:hypothetical protein